MIPSYSFAQDYYYPDFYIYAALGPTRSLEPGDFGRYWGDGININLGVGYQPSRGIIAGIFLRYYSFPVNKDRIRERAAAEGADSTTDPEPVTIPSGGIFLRVDLFIKERSGIYPYLVFNMGLVKPSDNSIDAFDSTRTWFLVRAIDNELLSCFSSGVGLEVRVLEQIHFYAEIRYVQVLQVRTNCAYLPFNLGIAVPFRVF